MRQKKKGYVCFRTSLWGLSLSIFVVKLWCLVKKFLLGHEGEGTGELSKDSTGETLEKALCASPCDDAKPWTKFFIFNSTGLLGLPSTAGKTSSGNGSSASSPSKQASWGLVKLSSLFVSFCFVIWPIRHSREGGMLGSENRLSCWPMELFNLATMLKLGSELDSLVSCGLRVSRTATVAVDPSSCLLGEAMVFVGSTSGSLLS